MIQVSSIKFIYFVAINFNSIGWFSVLLDNICEWILEHNELCRPQDIASLFLTLATLNYQPSDITNLNDKLVKNLNKADLPKNCDWLNMVWSLVVLNLATHDHINSVLK